VSVLASLQPLQVRAMGYASEGPNGFRDKHPIGPESFAFKSLWDFTVFGLTIHITRIVTMLIFGIIVVAAFFLLGSRKAKVVPGRLQFAAESIYAFIRNGVAGEVIGPEQGLKFAPYFTVLFSFILMMNLYEIIPFAQTPVTGRIAFPFILATISWVLFNYVGIKHHGTGPYFKAMLFPPGVPKPLYVLLTPIEFFSTIIARPFTLAVRLLMNMFAGHLLVLVFTTGTLYLATRDNISVIFTPVSFLMAILMTFFELLVIGIQAYVFTVLTAVYVSGALAEEH
jgi:F-type H+-transporting ATPase subunit a